MVSNSNRTTKEDFIKGIVHPRKKQLAEMLLNGATPEELTAASFDRSRVIEMSLNIAQSVEGMENFYVSRRSKHNIALDGDVPGRSLTEKPKVATTEEEKAPEVVPPAAEVVVPPAEVVVPPTEEVVVPPVDVVVPPAEEVVVPPVETIVDTTAPVDPAPEVTASVVVNDETLGAPNTQA